MKRALTLVITTLALSGCAQTLLDQAERDGLGHDATHLNLAPPADFHAAVERARDLSTAYAHAARNLNTAQDVSFFLTLVAAGTYSIQAASAAGTAELTRLGTAGAATGIVATRYHTQSAIQAIYTGAQQMDCIATAAQIGHDLLHFHGPNTGHANLQEVASVAVASAINQSHLRLRSMVTQEAPNFGTILTDLRAANEDGPRLAQDVDVMTAIELFASFAALLNGCFPANEGPIPVPALPT